MTRRPGAPHARPAVAAGERIYAIGRQDGSFPPTGWHLAGDMGGVWAHPIRLARGFDLRLGEASGAARLWRAERHSQGRLSTRFWGAGPGGVRVERRDHADDDDPVLWVRLRLRAPRANAAHVRSVVDVHPHIRDVWPAPPPDAPQIGPAAADDGVQVWHRPGLGAVAALLVAASPVRFRGTGLRGRWRVEADLAAGARVDLHLVLAGGSSAAAAARLAAAWWRERRIRVARRARTVRAADRSGRLRFGDAAMTRALADLTHSSRWLTRTVPGVGRGMTAGLADYPWWFGCDGAYIALGLLASGQPDLCRDTLDAVARAADRASLAGRIPHEVTTRGQVVHPGNAVETAHWAWAACHYIRFAGDLEFAARHYGRMRAGLAGLLASGDLPVGHGIMEIAGLNQRLVDTAAYTWAALGGLAGVASLLGRPDDAVELQASARRVERAVEAGLWLEDAGVYADWRAHRPDAEATTGLRAYALRHAGPDAEARLAAHLAALPERDETASRPFGNWVTWTPLAVGLAPRNRAVRALRHLRRTSARIPTGLRLSEALGERPMTISTLVAAAACARYGERTMALSFLRAVTDATGRLVPRAVSEMLPVGGCFVQGWTLYARWVIMSDLLGLEVDAARRRLSVHPPAPLPVALALEGLPAGRARLCVRADAAGAAICVDAPGWDLAVPGAEPAALTPGRWHAAPSAAEPVPAAQAKRRSGASR